MKKNLYKRTIEELRMSIENIWEMIHVQPKEDMPPVIIPVTVEMLNELTDRDDFDLKVSDPANPSYLLIANDPEMESIIGALNALILNRLVTRVNT